MYTTTREYSFSAAHRLEGHPRCGRLHGHNYTALVEISGSILRNGVIIDPLDLDRIVRPVLDLLDRRYLVSAENVKQNDPYYLAAKEKRPGDLLHLEILRTTAEEIAGWLAAELAGPLEILNLSVASLTLYQTDRDSAAWINAAV